MITFIRLFFVNSYVFCIILYILINNNLIRYYVMLSSYGGYNIFLPIVSYFWIKLGFKPVITIVYHTYDLTLPFIYSILQNEGATVQLKFVSNKSNLNYYSRIDRIFNFITIGDKNGVFITSDADMIVLNKHLFKNINYNKFNIMSLGLKGYGSGKANRRWPMCYFISKIDKWREILQLDKNITKYNIDEYVNCLITTFLKRDVKYYEGSYHRVDEIFMRDKIRESTNFPHNVVFTKRNFSKSRIPKQLWKKIPHNVNWSNIYDIHLPTHLSNYTNIWSELLKLLNHFNIKCFGMEYLNKYFSLKNNIMDV